MQTVGAGVRKGPSSGVGRQVHLHKRQQLTKGPGADAQRRREAYQRGRVEDVDPKGGKEGAKRRD